MNEDQIQDRYKQTPSACDADSVEVEYSEQKTSVNPDKEKKLASKLKETWSSLSDSDVALYISGKKDQFFDVLEEKHGLFRDEAGEHLQDIEQSCGCATNKGS